MSRFVAGDTVVLNGHRVTVKEVHDDSLTVALVANEMLVGHFPQDWVPDPEPRDESRWEPGDIVRDATGAVYQRSEDGPGWHRPADLLFYEEGDPERPLVRLVPEGSEREALTREIMEHAVQVAAGPTPPVDTFPPGTSVEDAHDRARRETMSFFWFQGKVHHVWSTCPTCQGTPAPNPDDHRDEWDTFGTKRGVVVAEPAPAPASTTAGSLQYMPDPYVCQQEVPSGGLADDGVRCGKRNPCPDHAVTYDDAEGDLDHRERHELCQFSRGGPIGHVDPCLNTRDAHYTGEWDHEFTSADATPAPPLTPGMTVAVRVLTSDLGHGTVLALLPAETDLPEHASVVLHSNGAILRYPLSNLRPVSLVEKPGKKAAVERIWAAFESAGRRLDSGEAALLAYEALFPGGPS